MPYQSHHIGLAGRVFANCQGEQGSIPGRVIQKTQNWYLIHSCLKLSIVSLGSRVKWSNPGKGVVPFRTPRYSSYWKRNFLFALDYCRQLYIYIYRERERERKAWNFSLYSYIYIYIYIYEYKLKFQALPGIKSERDTVMQWPHSQKVTRFLIHNNIYIRIRHKVNCCFFFNSEFSFS